jgi:hypothetical protein
VYVCVTRDEPQAMLVEEVGRMMIPQHLEGGIGIFQVMRGCRVEYELLWIGKRSVHVRALMQQLPTILLNW